MIEVDTYRYFHQNGPFPGSAFGYRSKDEEQAYRDRDPILKVEGHLKRRGLYTDEVVAVRKSIKATMSEIGFTGRAGPGRQARPAAHRPHLWPDTAFLDVGIRGDLSGLEGRTVRDRDFTAGELEPRKFIDIVAETMQHRMDEDPSIV